VRILVTGAFGYLGLAVVRRLAGEHAVTALGHPPRRPVALPPGVSAVEADVLDLPPIGPLDAVVHLAAAGADADMTRLVRTNVLGTQLVLDAARAAGATRLVLASTIAVYGTRRTSPALLRETDATAADEPVGATKEAAERLWTAQGGVALRLATVYGIGAGIGPSGPLAALAHAAARGGDLDVAPGTGKFDVVAIEDAADAFAAALTAARPPSVLNIGNGREVRRGEFAAACISAAHKHGRAPRVVLGPIGEQRTSDQGLSVGLAIATLAWQPRRRLQEVVDRMVAAFVAEPTAP
jgi:UDP-glucose 4-epimerase